MPKFYGIKNNSNYVIKDDSTLWEIGRNRRFNVSLPTLVTPYSWTEISNGFLSSSPAIALQSNGTLWSWGNNIYGQLGLSDTTNRSTPVQVGALSNWSQITTGALHCLAIKTDGTLWGWGDNNNGNLGLNTVGNQFYSPIQVGTLSTWYQTSAGFYHSLAIQSNGTLWAAGRNVVGQLGNNTTSDYRSFVQVGSLSTWTKVDCGFQNTFALQSDNTMWSWGNNESGSLGLSDTTNRSTPVQVGTLSVWTKISATGSSFNPHCLAVQTNGSLWAWGANDQGQLGLSDTTNRFSPVQVGTLSNWSDVACGYRLSMAIKTDGSLWIWGNNGNGQLGLSDTSNRSSPVQVGNLNVWSKMSSSGSNTLALKTDGSLWTWGNNSLGLGYDLTSYRSSAIQVGIANTWVGFPTGSQNSTWSAVLNTNGGLYIFGDNSDYLLDYEYYQADTVDTLAFGTNIISPVPVDSTSNTIVSQATFGDKFGTFIRNDGALWSWGSTSFGQIPITFPLIPGLVYKNNWSQIAGGNVHTAALQSNGTLWTCGYNGWGQLGLSNAVSRSSFVQVGTDSNWSKVSLGNLYTTSIKTDGTLWAWGNNSFGQLGQSNTTVRYSPVQVGTLSDWAQISNGLTYIAAIKTDNTLWAWGGNANGQLGLSNITDRYSPVQVGALSNWAQISCGYDHACALDGNNFVWNFGRNLFGQLGNNTTTNFISPTLLIHTTLATNWSKITSGLNHTLAIRTDGFLFSWGNNSFGQLGVSDVTHRSSIVQIGSANNWAQIACGQVHSVAINSQGFLYAWGNNSYAQLGQPAIPISINVSTPIQVGSLSNYSNVFCTNFTTLANLK